MDHVSKASNQPSPNVQGNEAELSASLSRIEASLDLIPGLIAEIEETTAILKAMPLPSERPLAVKAMDLLGTALSMKGGK